MKKLFIILFSIISVIGSAQEKKIYLNWIETDSMVYFAQASYTETGGMMPAYTEVLPWKDTDKAPVVHFAIDSSSLLNEKYSNLIPYSQLSNTPQLSYNIVFENKKPFLQISLLPFFVNKASEIERVESFTLEIGKEELLAGLKALKKGQFASKSILADNDWYKIEVHESGMYKLSYETLREIGIGNPATVKIFGAGAIQLPEDFSKGSYDDLSEIPLYMVKGNDQLFGPGDYLLFYAQGPVSWKFNTVDRLFEQNIHDYATSGFYFLTDDLGTASAPRSINLSTEKANMIVTSFDIHEYAEEEKYNLLSSGREWYGEKFKLNLTGAYPFTLKNLLAGQNLKIKVSAAGRSNEQSSMQIKANGTNLGSLDFSPVNMSSYTSTYALEKSKIFSYNTSNEILSIQVEFMQPNSNSIAWLNYITINGRAKLELTDKQLFFRDKNSVSTGFTSEFQLANANANTVIWDITDPNEPKNIPFILENKTAKFKVSTESLKEYLAFNITMDFPVPQFKGKGLGKIPNQNLHGINPPELLIVYPEEFKEQVDRLADHRREHDGMTVLTVTQEKLYNEFSSGTPNISALRNYLKMFYDKDQNNMIKYLLLFGDGSYDNRDTAAQNPNKILTYQSPGSLNPTGSYVSDDFYGLLDTGEDLYDGLLDIGIGRLPASTVDEAELLVDKILEYDQPETMGEWRNFICLIGDDEDGNIHMKQANSLANYIEANYPSYNISKIFMDAYLQETTSTGDLYPDVTRAINDQMNRGALIINYTGHGGTTGLAHEKILDLTNIKAWKNEGKYPLFLTATCEFSRFDEYKKGDNTGEKNTEITSAGEEVLLNPEGGSIALFTTTRLVYSGPNHVLNEKFYEIIFEKKENGDCYRLGDVIAYSKNHTGAGINKRNFTLLGDPTISLAFPKNRVLTDSVNHKAVELAADTLSALDYVTISGHIEDQTGNKLNIDGTVIPIVYDKKMNLKTLANDGGTPMAFQTRNNILYKGNVSVSDGEFVFSFYVPKDIGYNVGEGKISYYAFSGNTDAHGSTNEITIGGLGDFSDIDTTGPSIKLFMNDSLFKNGGIVDDSPELLIYVEDLYGINTTGNGIGHDITATLNEDRINAIILNEYYLADSDSYSSGTVRYPYSNLEVGDHNIKVKVWDIFNNSSTKTISFKVVESMQMLLNEIYNYPNPFIDLTYFNIEHNRPDQDIEVTIRIYDIQGNLVTILQDHQYSTGYRIDPLSWSGQATSGTQLGGGIYVYKVLLRTGDGEEAIGSGRLIIKR